MKILFPNSPTNYNKLNNYFGLHLNEEINSSLIRWINNHIFATLPPLISIHGNQMTLLECKTDFFKKGLHFVIRTILSYSIGWFQMYHTGYLDSILFFILNCWFLCQLLIKQIACIYLGNSLCKMIDSPKSGMEDAPVGVTSASRSSNKKKDTNRLIPGENRQEKTNNMYMWYFQLKKNCITVVIYLPNHPANYPPGYPPKHPPRHTPIHPIMVSIYGNDVTCSYMINIIFCHCS